MTAPAVSVLLPVRDGAAFLGEALESLRTQAFEDFEVIVQDDGSTDASPRIARAVAASDARFHVASGPPLGIPASLDRAAGRARGKILVRMDADDVSRPTRLAETVAAMEAHADVGLLGSLVEYFPAKSVSDGMRRYESWINGVVTHEAMLAARFIECPLPHPTWALRRSTYDVLGGYRDGPFPEDYDLFLRAAGAGVRFHKIPSVLVDWREGAHRASRSDPRYGSSAFFALKVHYLALHLRRREGPVAVVGAGRTARRWMKRLREAGVDVRALLDPDSGTRRTPATDVVVHPFDHVARLAGHRLVCAVGVEGGRDRLCARLAELGFVEGVDLFCAQ